MFVVQQYCLSMLRLILAQQYGFYNEQTQLDNHSILLLTLKKGSKFMAVQHIGNVPLRSVLSVLFTQKRSDSAEILYFFVEPPMPI